MCNFCENIDFGSYRAETEQVGGSIQARISTAGGSGRFAKEEQFNFCPKCGKNLKSSSGEKSNRIEVDTFFGKLFAEVGCDPAYPGIVICVERNGKDGTYDHQLTIVECTPDYLAAELHALRLMVWGNNNIEDYTESHTFFVETASEPPEVIWAKYLQYLRDWASGHADAAHLGMTPVCFDEWRSSEYDEKGGSKNEKAHSA